MTDEIMKLIVCVIALLWAYSNSGRNDGYRAVGQNGPAEKHSILGFISFFKREVFKSFFEFFKMSVPALLYAIQKNLLYVAVSNLDAAVFQVAYQGKILTTALFSVLILGKRLSTRQVTALVILLVGVALVQLSSMESSQKTTSGDALTGSLAVMAACFTSGFAAIYFEWVLKFSTQTSNKEQESYALWVRNFQLATFASIAAAFGVFTKDLAAVEAHGVYQGFTPLVWFVVTVEAFGGIVVALVIKYADNILKNFATAISIVTSVIVSALFLNFTVRPAFVMGTLCVMGAVVLYTSNGGAVFSRPKDEEMKPIEKAEI
jgi:UDP-sugar transporter A1/2/3